MLVRARLNLGSICAVLVAAVVLVAGFDLATYAATGDSLILGKINKAAATTTVTNTGRGAVLNLKGGALYPPLQVNSKKRVANLNADTVDGLDSKALEPGVFRAVLAAKGSTLQSSPAFSSVKLPAGTYLINLSGIVTNETTSDDGLIICLVIDAEKTFAAPPDVNFAGIEVAIQKDLSVSTGEGVFSDSSVYTIAANHHSAFQCNGSVTTGALTVQKAVVATFRKVGTPTSLPTAPYVPPSPRLIPRRVPH